MSRWFPCGEIAYRLERPIGGSVHQLSLRANLVHSVKLEIAVTCPGLTDLGPFRASHPDNPPAFQRASGRLAWSLELLEGETNMTWVWG